ncbi:MAG: caspase family protein [Saprospiraceae bacterium]|nr:caspase family protein [Saprospiraceae bacterium]MCF8250658.1 caspase family protein [Saprospiraceae bacterium]MCF8280796.1 caspase family protein [Bacteroidales bacterium]MCF8312510.1 caspase family protein [Saprospiraceae bacterium]MCF8440810.1 caspase family protein [Saprospiraceae bacterium]
MGLKVAKKKIGDKHYATDPLRLNPAKTKFLLVGVSSFSIDSALPGVLNDIAHLKRTLLSSVVGMPEENVIALINPPSDLILENIRVLVNEADLETIVIYFSGTSTVNNDKVFELACSPATQQKNGYDLLPITAVDEALGDTTANVVVFLDCCHSQAAFINLYLENFFIMTAASVDQVTYEQMIDGEQRGVFTHYLVKALAEGVENGKEWLNLSDLYLRVRELLANATEENVTEPKMMTTNMVSFLEIARNSIRTEKPERPKLHRISAFQLKNLVAEDELGKVLTQMMEAAKENNDLLNTIVTLKNQLTDYENKKILNLFFEQEGIVIKSRLTQSILSSIDFCKHGGLLDE